MLGESLACSKQLYTFLNCLEPTCLRFSTLGSIFGVDSCIPITNVTSCSWYCCDCGSINHPLLKGRFRALRIPQQVPWQAHVLVF